MNSAMVSPNGKVPLSFLFIDFIYLFISLFLYFFFLFLKQWMVVCGDSTDICLLKYSKINQKFASFQLFYIIVPKTQFNFFFFLSFFLNIPDTKKTKVSQCWEETTLFLLHGTEEVTMFTYLSLPLSNSFLLIIIILVFNCKSRRALLCVGTGKGGTNWMLSGISKWGFYFFAFLSFLFVTLIDVFLGSRSLSTDKIFF